jgi:hypothetical protein
VADTVTTCPKCGNLLAVDSYGATSFAPVMPAPQPAAHVAVKNQPVEQLGVAQTIMSTSQPIPPTMASNSPNSPRNILTPGPQYVVTPAHGSPMQQPVSPHAHMPTMQSAMPMPMAPPQPSNAMVPYAPPPQPYGSMPYPMMMQQPAPMSQQGTPGLAIASLVCGLLGLVPLWIGFVLCLLAITFGGIVLAGTRPGQPGRGLAITGLVFGLLFILPAACGL